MELIIATRNKGKIREIDEALSMPGLRLLTFEEFDDFPEPEETGSTLEENALIKARAVSERFGKPALADDSGLLVDRLGGRPGVCSSRYAGPEGDPERNMDRLLSELEGVPAAERTARFSCIIALVIPGGEERLTHGECKGRILEERRGAGGFGYDPVFLPDGFDRSMAELTLEEKNAISHRGKALRTMRQELERPTTR
jgi:non-canonical purine NTP pyrophosphatase (RdgB/HAM1 family)